jgi:hypothetical protein
MPEEQVQIAYLIVMFVALMIVATTFSISNPFKATYGNLSQTREMITITNVVADAAWNAIITYTINTNVNFHVDPDPTGASETVINGIIPFISFKGSYARATLPQLYQDNVIRLDANGEDDYNVPDMQFTLKSNIPPFSIPASPVPSKNSWVYDSVTFKRGQTYLFEDNAGNRYLISLSSLEMGGGVLGIGKTCRAKFRIECANDLKESGTVKECNAGESEEKCTDTTVLTLCKSGTVAIKANELRCGFGDATVNITTTGGTVWEKDFGETATLSLFRNSKCVNIGLQRALEQGINILNENCPNDFLGSKKIMLVTRTV